MYKKANIYYKSNKIVNDTSLSGSSQLNTPSEYAVSNYVNSAVENENLFDKSSNKIIAHTATDILSIDEIVERNENNGVDIEGILLKDEELKTPIIWDDRYAEIQIDAKYATDSQILLKNSGTGEVEVRIDGTLSVDLINEYSTNGVTIDGVVCKDGKCYQVDDSAPTTDTQLVNKKYITDQQYWNRATTTVSLANTGDIVKVSNFEPEDGYNYSFLANDSGHSRLVINRDTNTDDSGLILSTTTGAKWYTGLYGSITSGDDDYRLYNTTGSKTALLAIDDTGDVACPQRLAVGTNETNQYAMLNIIGADSSETAGPHIWMSHDEYATMQLLPLSHNTVSILMDCYYVGGGGFKSSSANSNFRIYKSTTAVNFQADTGVSVGNTVSFNTLLTLVLGDGHLINTGSYNYTCTGRPLEVDASGNIGNGTSKREHKTNITDITQDEANIIYQLTPRKFNRFLWKDGQLTNIVNEVKEYGYIAEEIEEVEQNNNVDMIITDYDRYDLLKDEQEPPEGATTHPTNDKLIKKPTAELHGIRITQLIPLLTKCVQDQKIEITYLNSQIATLKGQMTNVLNQIGLLQMRTGTLEGFHSI